MDSSNRGESKAAATEKVQQHISSIGSGDSSQSPKHVLREDDPIAYQSTGFCFKQWKKWAILSVIFLVQVSMNFNAAIYANSVPGMKEEFGISDFTARLGQFAFLVCYAFGCELWAPWSEELGRKWVMQMSLGLVNVFQIPCMLSTSFTTVLVGRIFGGLSSAGGSVTLGIVADMFEADRQQFACAYVVFSSVAGSVVAPIAGGFITEYLNWRWVFYMQLILGVIAQFAHLFVPETRSSVLLDKEATRRRRLAERSQADNQQYDAADLTLYGPNEIRGPIFKRISFKHGMKLMWRPYHFLLTEPIVTFLSLLSGFSDALIFTGLDSYGMVLGKWDFGHVAVGLSFISLLFGYILAYLFFVPFYRNDTLAMKHAGGVHGIRPERRLKAFVWLVALEPIGLFGFAWASLGPPQVHWIAPMIFSAMIGIANYAIYMATIDYMIAAYAEYSASATGGNGFCRDFLAGIAALYAKPFYTNIKTGTKWQLPIPTFILTVIGMILCIPVFVFYLHGEYFRKRSPFAQSLEAERENPMRDHAIEFASRRNSPPNSASNSPRNSPPVSGRASLGNLQARDSLERLHERQAAEATAAAVVNTDVEKGAIPISPASSASRPLTISRTSTLRLTKKGVSANGRLGETRIIDDETGEELDVGSPTSERKGTSVSEPSSPVSLTRSRTQSEGFPSVMVPGSILPALETCVNEE